jgi:hypothetical protein
VEELIDLFLYCPVEIKNQVRQTSVKWQVRGIEIRLANLHGI